MQSYLTRVWHYRHFWLNLVRMDLRTRYRRSLLGVGWSLLQPLTMTLVLCMVFQQFMNVTPSSYVPHLLTGMVLWNFITGCALFGCQSFFQSEAYIRQCPLPLAVYPLRTALGALFHLSMGMVVMIVMAGILCGPSPPGVMLSLVPSLALLFIFGWSMTVLSSTANVFFQDTQHLGEVLFQILFYLTPIIYRLEDFKDKPFAWVFWFNPFIPFLSLIREPLLLHAVPGPSTYLPALGITAVTTVAAGWVLSRMQNKLIFHL